MKKKAVRIVLAVILLALIVGFIGLVSRIAERYTPTKERMDGTEYFGLSDASELALVLQDEVLSEKGLLEDGVAYLNYEVVKEYLNNRFFWDETESLMLYTTPDAVIEIPAESTEYQVAGETSQADHVIVRAADGQTYIAAEFVKQYTAMDYELYELPNRLVITYKYGTVSTAAVKGNAPVRELGGIKSLILTELSKGDQVTVLEQMEKWTKVVTEDGYIGYVRNSRLGALQETELTSDFEEPVYSSIHKDYTVSMVWHQVTSQDSNDALLSDIAEMTGVTTISPTWFSISNNDGDITSLASASYVTDAHARGLEVWALIDNFSTDIDTQTVLGTTTSRQNLITQLVQEALQYDLDGINVDFEAIPEAAGDAYIEFLRELSVQCRQNGIVLSVDDPVPMDFNAYYQRAAQAEVVDYIAVMCYDEHYVGSEAGSVASISFATSGIADTIAAGVPAEKVILGVPFYTRLWRTDSVGNVTSEAFGMETAASILSENGVTAAWDESTGQDYASFTDSDGYTCQIWLENAASLEEKLKLLSEYDLGGVSAWKLGFETSSIWTLIRQYTEN